MPQLALLKSDFYSIDNSSKSKPGLHIGTLSKKGQRERLYLKPDQVEKLIQAAKNYGRHGRRNTLMLTMAFRHGLRASELCGMKWDNIDLDGGTILVKRLKAGHTKNPQRDTEHDLGGDEIRALRALLRENEESRSQYVFLSQKGGSMTRRQFHRLVSELGIATGFTGPIYPHRLRHSCGYKLAEEGKPTRDIQKFLGHSQINNTAWYTDVSDKRIKKLWWS